MLRGSLELLSVAVLIEWECISCGGPQYNVKIGGVLFSHYIGAGGPIFMTLELIS